MDNLMERESHLTIEDFKKDAASLNQKYPTVEAIVDYLDELGENGDCFFCKCIVFKGMV